MAENKTRATTKSFKSYVTAISDPERREDCRMLANLMCEVTGAEPTMWGPSIVGFGSYHYRYDSGREGDMCLTGFSSRKQDLTIYLSPGYAEDEPLLQDLGKHKTGLGCLYIKKLADIDLAILKQLSLLSVQTMKQRYPDSR
jgi:hypothetical protein